jgi:3-oxoacyl-ACP reductase-like protein
MSIFTRIKDAIFGAKVSAAPAPPKAAPPTPPRTAPVPSAAQAPRPSPAPFPEASNNAPVDVEAVLQALSAKQSQKLNWRTSIVDLMKLLDLDSSLQNRKELARELGFTGDMNDSATMNIWLHKRVMTQLAANGGKVPDELKE